MPTKSSPNGVTDVLSGLRLPPVYEWVESELPEVNEGLTRPLRIQVLVNPPRPEIFAMAKRIEEHYRQVQERYDRARAEAERVRQANREGAEKARAEEQDPPPAAPVPPIFDAAQDRLDDIALFDIIKDRVVAWNVEAWDRHNAVVDLPPPAEIGGVVVDLLSNQQRRWIVQMVQMAHLGGETRSKLSRRPAATDDTEGEKTPSGPRIVDTPTGETRPGHRKSS